MYTNGMLHKTIRSDMQEAMKNRDQVRLDTLRLVAAACTEALVAKRRKPTEILDDGEVITVLKRMVKQRKESAQQYQSVGHADRAATEDAERKVLETYLPPAMDDDEVRSAVLRHKDALGVTEKKDMGMVVRAVMEEVGDRTDGATVARIAGSELS